jgi:hypothetical protein
MLAEASANYELAMKRARFDSDTCLLSLSCPSECSESIGNVGTDGKSEDQREAKASEPCLAGRHYE